MKIYTDQYGAYKKEMDQYGFTAVCTPVDSAGNFVPLDKTDKDNLKNMQDDILDRFEY